MGTAMKTKIHTVVPKTYHDIATWFLGASVSGIILALAWMWISPPPFNYALTPTGFGKALFLVLPVSYAVFGIHELGHYLTATDYCHYKSITYRLSIVSVYMLLSGLIYIGAIVGLDVFFNFDIAQFLTNIIQAGGITVGRSTVALFVASFVTITPGAVAIAGRGKIRRCEGETAIMGPLANILLSVVLIIVVGGIPTPYAGMSYIHSLLVVTFYLSLLLGFVNALPLGTGNSSTDGYKAFNGNNISRMLDVVVLLASLVFIGYTLIQ